jgi:protein TonB
MSSPRDRTPAPRKPASLVERKQLARAAARQRIAARTTRALPASLRVHDPLVGEAATITGTRILIAVAISVVAHVAIVAIGLAVGDRDEKVKEPLARIEVRERPPEPPPLPPEPAPEPPPPGPTAIAPEPPNPKAEPRPRPTPPPVAPVSPEPPPEPGKKPPPRVVGISMDSTTQGGDGPGFAVGNTGRGETDSRAVDPKKVVPGATGPATDEPTAPAPTPNAAATRIPGAGGKVTMPKRKKTVKPRYPETLQSQGIEADVAVIVSIDATGKVTNVKVAKSSGYPEFDEAARLTALEDESFEPAVRDSQAIPYTLSFTYRFRLEDK